jgi:hypothetical protein
MQSTTQQAFEEMFQDHENNFCFECGSPSNHWASVNNGIFLCLNCSGLHRGFGVNVSFVRSVTMDSWSDLQLAMMKNGGNSRLRAFFDNYKIPRDGPVDFKYRTKAGAYYRDMLKALSEGRPLPNPPDLTEGLELLANKNPNYNPSNNTGVGSTPVEEETTLNKVKTFMGTAVDKTVQAVDKTVQATREKVAEPQFKIGVLALGATVASGAKNLATNIKTKVTDPNLKDDVKAFGGKVATGTKEAAGKITDKSKEIWNHKDEYLHKGSEAAKQGFSATVGFFKKLTGSKNANSTDNSSSSEEQINKE